jgi:glycyl-tRNA synthetase beta subunit
MEKEKLELNEFVVGALAKFFLIAGYKDFAKELEDAWNDYDKSVNLIFWQKKTTNGALKTMEVLDADITKSVADYKSNLEKLKKTFAHYFSKVAVMTDEAKWRRCII